MGVVNMIVLSPAPVSKVATAAAAAKDTCRLRGMILSAVCATAVVPSASVVADERAEAPTEANQSAVNPPPARTVVTTIGATVIEVT